MSSELVLDELTGRGSAGSIAVTAEGGTVTTNLQQGLAKHWVFFKGTDTFTRLDSFNSSTLVDDDTAIHTTNFTVNFENANYASSLSLGHTNISNGWGMIEEANTARATSSLQVTNYNGDFVVNSIILHGDLA